MQRKIEWGGIRYNCMGQKKCDWTNKNPPDEIIKYYSCRMVWEGRNGIWKQDQQKRGSVKVEGEEVKQKKGRGGEKMEKKNNAKIITCGETLTVVYQRRGLCTFKIGHLHKCTVGQGGSGGPDNWIPMAVIMPNLSQGVRRDDSIK
jgi:hypothetical protein